MRKKIVVHIGTHKTGTTTIQNVFENNREELKTLGVLYPATNREPYPALPKHTSVFHAMGNTESAEIERKILLDEFEKSNCNFMIISEEGLAEPRPGALKFFAPFTENYDIHVVAYLRRQDMFVESLYNQFVRERGEQRLISEFCRAPRIKNRLDYHGILTSWRELGTVSAFNFDSVKSRLSDSLLEAVGAPALNGHETRENVSPDMRIITALVYMYRTGLKFDRQAMLNTYKRVYTGQTVKKTILGANLRAEVLQWCAPSNEKLQADFAVSFNNENPIESFYPNDIPEIDAAFAALALMSAESR